jgi:hypothetical protein
MTRIPVSLSHYAEMTLEEMGDFGLEWLSNPSVATSLSASIVLAPMTNESSSANRVIDPLITALAKQFSYLYDKTYEIGLMRKIEFAKGTDLDTLWGNVYQVKRLSGESDDNYRKRLQVYIKQLTGSGTAPACEDIISIIVECPNSCRIDTYWPAFCRIYITDARARKKARQRASLIALIAPQMLPAGVTYRFYVPYYDLEANIALLGRDDSILSATVLLQDESQFGLFASIYLAKICRARLAAIWL